MKGKYETLIDRDSAYERLRARSEAAAREAAAQEKAGSDWKIDRKEIEEFRNARRYDPKGGSSAERPRTTSRSSSSRSDSVAEAFAKSFARQLGTKSGQAVIRGVLGTLFGKK